MIRLASTVVSAAFLAASLLPGAAQAEERPVSDDHVHSAVEDLFARDAERVLRADRLLESQDIERYDVTVCVDPERGWLSCECTIAVRSPGGTLRFLLDEDLSVSNVRGEDGELLPHERSGAALEVDLSADPSGDSRSVEVHYEGPLSEVGGGGSPRSFALLGPGEHWYPSPPEYDAAVFRMVVRYPDGYSSVATGALVGMAPLREASRDPCTVGDVWAAETPIPAAAVAVGQFASSLSVSGNVFLGYHWAVGPDRSSWRASPPERGIKELLRYLESCYGPYPYDWLNVVSVPNGLLGDPSVVAAPGLVAIDERAWRRPGGVEYRMDRLCEGLAESWWRYCLDTGEMVADGLAGMSAVGWQEARGDEEAALRLREERRAAYVRALADSGGRAPLSACLGPHASRDGRICLGKASAVFGVLERVIGRGAFCAALRLLASEEERRIGLEDVARAFEESAERSLEWFFYEWFCRADLPTYSLEYEIVTDETGPLVRGTIRQQGEIYRTPVPLTVDLGGWSYNEWVPIESSEQNFEFRADMEPLEITVDGQRLIPRIDSEELAAAHFRRGAEAARASEWSAAVDEFGEAASLEGESALYRFRYGDALVHSGRLADGLEVLESAVELAPEEPAYRLTLARLYLGALAYEEALLHFDEYVRISGDPAGHLGRARALIGLGRLGEARDAIDAARPGLDTTTASDAFKEKFFLVLGSFDEAVGDSAAAVSEYERAIEVNPVSDEARRRLEALGSGKE